MQRQWQIANAMFVIPALFCFLVLFGFGIYLLHVANTTAMRGRELANTLVTTTINESRAARGEAKKRAHIAETALARVLDSLISKADSITPAGQKPN